MRPSEIFREITAVYGSAIDESSVRRWRRKFDEGKQIFMMKRKAVGQVSLPMTSSCQLTNS